MTLVVIVSLSVQSIINGACEPVQSDPNHTNIPTFTKRCECGLLRPEIVPYTRLISDIVRLVSSGSSLNALYTN